MILHVQSHPFRRPTAIKSIEFSVLVTRYFHVRVSVRFANFTLIFFPF